MVLVVEGGFRSLGTSDIGIPNVRALQSVVPQSGLLNLALASVDGAAFLVVTI